MIDFHAHILPGADHGSRSVSESLMLLRAAAAVGVDAVVATPHFYLRNGSSAADFFKRRGRTYGELAGAVSGENLPKVLLGAEVDLRKGLSALDLKPFCIEGTDILLLELPVTGHFDNWVCNELADIIERQSLRVLLAHIDRYDASEIEKLFDIFPLYGQLNAASAVSLLKRGKVRRYLEQGLVWALGSDTHRSPKEYKAMSLCERHMGKYLPEIERRSAELLSGVMESKGE